MTSTSITIVTKACILHHIAVSISRTYYITLRTIIVFIRLMNTTANLISSQCAF